MPLASVPLGLLAAVWATLLHAVLFGRPPVVNEWACMIYGAVAAGALWGHPAEALSAGGGLVAALLWARWAGHTPS